MSIKIEVSFGELIDKITILEIKLAKIDDPLKTANVQTELDVLNAAWDQAAFDVTAIAEQRERLKLVNQRLWDIEDEIRLKEADKVFDADFVELARSVYQINDERARIKRKINTLLGSRLVEEKSYQAY